MKIPDRLKDLLKDDSLYGCVIESIKEFEPWLTNERPDFFPEYTNHGISHFESVVQTAEVLINDQSWKIFTPSDAVTLILSILLHDSAMHLTPDSFIALLNDHADEYYIKDLDSHTWTELWNDFLAEASRFDGRKLNNLFGSSDPIHPPELDPQKMTARDKKLIGEFLRRHHHSLAHQIACFGVPGPSPERLALKNVPMHIADLAGLAARSHGTSLRYCIDYLGKQYNNKCEHKGIHTVFIMALLRVADYLHIQADRAPSQISKIINVRSPLSKGHFDLHKAIQDVRFTHPDPEAIEIYAIPPNVNVFLKTKDLIDDIQKELDSSWAILGEIYGRMSSNQLNLFGLKYRRIRSNLDDIAAFAKNVGYIPYHAAFESAGADLLKLLIKPLYGDNPTFGIRELIQNAIDAVRERVEFAERHNLKDLDLPDQKADVIVSLNKDKNGELWLSISDTGIGMTSEIVRNYFLRAGASFRNSDTWKKEFTNEQGRSSILRSGRFGVGALAAFLIGDSIEVITRHISLGEDEAIHFNASIDADSIELMKTSSKVGTSLKIKVRKEISEKFSTKLRNEVARTSCFSSTEYWQDIIDWYSSKFPSLKCFIAGRYARSLFLLPDTSIKLPPEWRMFHTKDFPTILWTYRAKAPHISCNGIAIENKINPNFLDWDYPYGHRDTYMYELVIGASFYMPKISVLDPDGKLPISLDRTHLTGKLPFQDELATEIIKDFLAYTLVAGSPITIFEHNLGRYDGGNLDPIKFVAGQVDLDNWFFTPYGFSITCSQHISNCITDSCILTANMRLRNNAIKTSLEESILFSVICGTGTKYPKRLIFTRFALNAVKHSTSPKGAYGIWPSVRGARIILPQTEITRIKKPKNLKKQIRSNLVQEDKIGRWGLYRFGDCPEPSNDFIRLYKSISNYNPECDDSGQSIAEWYFHKDAPKPICKDESPILKLWHEIIGDAVIPYNPDDRKKKLAHAFKELAPYIQAHEEFLRKQREKK